MAEYVYILQGKRKKSGQKIHYIGFTRNFNRRIIEHISGKSRFTSTMCEISLYKMIEVEKDGLILEKLLKKNRSWVDKPDLIDLLKGRGFNILKIT